MHKHSQSIEIKLVENDVFIYATIVGLKKIISFCEKLLSELKARHLHFEDYNVFTKDFMRGIIVSVEEKL